MISFKEYMQKQSTDLVRMVDRKCSKSVSKEMETSSNSLGLEVEQTLA
jgi:hypothetical protein